jgi:hypothetical protein
MEEIDVMSIKNVTPTTRNLLCLLNESKIVRIKRIDGSQRADRVFSDLKALDTAGIISCYERQSDIVIQLGNQIRTFLV